MKDISLTGELVERDFLVLVLAFQGVLTDSASELSALVPTMPSDQVTLSLRRDT